MKIFKAVFLSVLIIAFFFTAGVAYAQSPAEEASNKKGALTYLKQGDSYRIKTQYDQAIKAYTRALKINPKYATAYNRRALAYSNKGQYDRAISDYNKALEINPNYWVYYNSRGYAYRKKGQYQQALSDYNKALALNPRSHLVYTNRGYLYINLLNKRAKGCADYRRACEFGDCRFHNDARQRGDC